MNSASDTTPARRKYAIWLASAVAAFALLVGAAIPAAAAELMRVTFVRHGESLGNASGSIDSSTPGPVLSPKGQQQAEALVGTLGDNNYDAIYASTMVRTQLTAAPMSRYLGLPIQVLPGLQEIEAGIYEGTPESEAGSGYMLAPLAWALQGNRDVRLPGSIDGNEFDARMDGAVQTMYDNGDRNAIVFSHGAAIMFWTFMNVDNLTAAQKLDLMRQSLSNTGYVVVEGNPEDGWTLVNWNGQEFSPERTFGAEVKLQIRTLSRQLQAEAESIGASFATHDPVAIATALNRGINGAGFSLLKFNRAVTAEAIERLDKAVHNIAPASRIAPEVAEVPAVEAQRVAVVKELAKVGATQGEPTAATDSGTATTAKPKFNVKKGSAEKNTVKARTAVTKDAVKSKLAATAQAVKSRLGIKATRPASATKPTADAGSGDD
ncbi:hypothetical protein A5792_27425 [Mycolicibacterium peregrinum]|uniref:Phosphoglycerate mutase n=1 Tax=Mycolicibacterium peregrinum TaxID=43304 RepID=A0A1A0QVF2_MYCPR|nr:histidine phosphatase family protein [Mycolicibacterium peregrinum]OBB26092.1 hypothetical protein A5792_27425 [Mycolicibacterium peregrinum]